MSWVKLDDGFTDHPKIAHVGAIGAWLQIQALCYCNRNLTDGFVPYSVARAFLARGVVRTDDRGVLWTLGEHSGHQGLDLPDIDWPGELVKAGIWEVVAGGYRIHDYDHYQRRKVEVLAERRRHVNRQQNYVRRKVDGVNDSVNDGVIDAGPVPVPVPVPSGSGEKKLASLAKKSARDTRAQRASTWPQDFTLTQDRATLASEVGVEVPWEWNKFKDHHRAKGSRFVDWDAAWRTWIRNAVEFAERKVRR